MNNKYVNNHYIQKSFAKSWSDEDGNIKYIFDGEIERKKFNIDDLNKNQPISKKFFYSEYIEKGMNEIENDGIKVIKKIINSSKGLILYRHEIISLKFYLYLFGIRTDKFRNNIRNRTGDSLFNKNMDRENKDAKEIQEKYISKTIKFYNEFKNDKCGEFAKSSKNNLEVLDEFFESNDRKITKEKLMEFEIKTGSVEKSIINGISNFINHSRLIFIKFSNESLVLSDANSFCEYYPDNDIFYNQKIYEFFPLSPSVGVIVFNNILSISNQNYDSKIFKNSLKNSISLNKYKNQEKINYEIVEILNKTINDDYKKLDLKNKKMILMNIEQKVCQKYKDKYDEYNYKFILEKKEIAILCNAMMLVHNKNNIIIFKDYKDVAKAKKLIDLGLVYRMENYN